MTKPNIAAKAVAIDSFLKLKHRSAAKKSDLPTLDYQHKADQVVGAYQAYKDAETAFRVTEAGLLAEVAKDYAGQNGRFSKSFNVPGEETAGVQVVYQDRFTPIPIEEESALKKAAGSQYAELFMQKRDIRMQVTDDATLKLLLGALGESEFNRVFAITLSIVPADGMDERQFWLPKAVRSFLKQYKPSTKMLGGKE